ncbi:hypothetical protein EI94DRAFT_1719622 [Lactarius quietus]|nr:hypothetical protein EI94DRAFT_1719622 [Lactarius quietus]
MRDLLDYLMTRYDFPPELRSAKMDLRPPKDVYRRSLPSDRICRYFFPHPCTWGVRCNRTHLSINKIYDSLLWPDRSELREVDSTTCTVVPMPANNGQPVVKLPQNASSVHPERAPFKHDPPLDVVVELPTVQNADSVHPEPVPFNHDAPFDVVVQLPKVSPPDGDATRTESVDSEHPQTDSAVSQLQTPSNEPLDVERQQEETGSSNQLPVDSEESTPEPSGSDSTVDEGAGPGLLTPAATSLPLQALEPPLPQRSRPEVTCGRCIRPPNKHKYGTATSQHRKNTAGRAGPPSAARTERAQPFKGSPAQANAMQVSSRDNMTPALMPVGPISVRPTQQAVENVSPEPKAQVCALPASVPATAVERDPAVVVAFFRSVSPQPLPQHTSTSQQMTVRASPIPLHKTPLSQPPRPRDLRDQSSIPRHLHLPTDEIDYRVMDGTDVTLSGGFSLNKISTKLESLWFTIENVPETTQCATIARIVSPFGEAKSIQLRDENSAPGVFKVQMTNYREVVAAINGLDGREIPEFLGYRHTVHLSLPWKFTNRLLRDTYVRVSWPVPCKTGYAGYNTMKAAQKVVSKLDGYILRNHWITASVYEGIPILGAYNVRFLGLPTDVEAKFLNKFGPTEGTMFERPNYQAPDFGIPAVRRTLESFGKITSFRPVTPPYKDRLVRVWCCFESPDVTNAACELHRMKQRSLGMERIFVVRVLSVQVPISRAKFDLIEEDLHLLRQTVHDHTRGAHLDILTHKEDKEPAVRLVAEDSKTLARLRVELSEILAGQILKENGEQVWDDFFRGEDGDRFLEDLRASHSGVMIDIYHFRRCIRLIGTAQRREPVATTILSKLSSLRQHRVRHIPLGGKLIGVFFGPDLLAAQQRYGEENIRLDIQNQVLLVRGPETLYEEIQQLVHMVESRQVAKSNVDHCPVCFDPPVTPIYASCGHQWCKSCLVAYLSAASGRRSFPISCLGNQGRCTALIPIRLAKMVLTPTNFDALVLAAFHAYVQARPNEYHYCPTPDCPQAYPTGPQNAVISCPSCLARICPSCHVEFHEGVTCADREDGGDRLFQEWLQTHDVKMCPGCAAPIERAEGCNHMTCTRCHTHTCWVCLQTFPQGQGIYAHMRDFHGGIGL